MTKRTRPTTCMAHLVIDGIKPCHTAAVNSLASKKSYRLCEYHMWSIGMHAKKKPREKIVTKTRRRTIKRDETEHLRRVIEDLDSTIWSLRTELAARPPAADTPKTARRATDGTVYFLRIGGYIKSRSWPSPQWCRCRTD